MTGGREWGGGSGEEEEGGGERMQHPKKQSPPISPSWMEPSSSFYIWAIKIKGQKPCEKTPRARTCVCVCVCVRLFFCCFFLPLKCYAVNRRRRRRARAREPNVRSSVSFAVAVVCFGWSRRGGCLSKGWRCRRLGGGGARTVLITCSRSKPFWVRPRRGPAAGPGRCRRPRRRLRSWAVSWRWPKRCR